MYLIPRIITRLRSLPHILAVGLVVIGMTFLIACADDAETPATEAPQPTATSTSVATTVQPTQETPSATAMPASTDAATATATPSSPPLQVVATSNIVADWAEVVGGDRVEVFSLQPPGADPHGFMPGARDVAQVADADVVLSIGLGLEAGWLSELVHNASADESSVVALGEGVGPLEFSEEDHHDDHMDEGDDHHGEGEDHDETVIGRLLVADGAEAHLSVIDLSTDDVESGLFEIAAPNSTVYSSPTNRYGIVLARGPESGDDHIHIFDGGLFYVPSRRSLRPGQ